MEAKILMIQGPTQNQFSYNRILNKALRLAGISDEQVKVVSYLDEDMGFYGTARATVRELDPNVIVLLGEIPLHDVAGKIPIQDWRGSIISNWGVFHGRTYKCIPTFAPDWIQRGQFQHFWSLVTDLKKVLRQSEFPEIRETPWVNLIKPTISEAVDFLDGVPSDVPWCIDIETRAEQIACFSISHGNMAMCIPIQKLDGPAWAAAYEAAIWSAVDRLMKRNPFMVGQNLTFDMEYLFDYGLEPSGIHMDTMISHAINYPELPKSLAFLTSLYTDMPYHKSEGKTALEEALYRYNNKDTITTLWCAVEIEKQLRERGLWPVHDFVTKELGLALEMQRRHLKVDHAKREELATLVNHAQDKLNRQWEAKYPSTLTELANDVPDRPNVNSPVQVKKFLYKTLGLPEKTRNHIVVADETAISELISKHPEIEELDWILKERHLRKINSSYLNVELEQDGTLAGSWCVHGTETGRWSSGKSPRGRGLNLQTVPKPVRWMIVPPEVK